MFGFSYWFIPVFSGCVWLGTLLAMLGVWVNVKHEPHYSTFEPSQTIPYISDIGATSWGKPLFIAGSATSQVAFVLAFLAERWLRHKGRLAKNYNIAEKILSGFASGFAIIGAAGLILLTIFDTKRYPRVHESMLGVFIIAYIISAIFICAEYQRLGIHFRQYSVLRSSFWIKLVFIIVEICLAIAFGVSEYYKRWNLSIVFEWVISLIYIFYIFSFIIDFLPATRTRHAEDRFGLPHVRADDDEMAMRTQADGNMMGGPVYTNGGHYAGGADSASHGSQVPMTDERGYNQPSRNF